MRPRTQTAHYYVVSSKLILKKRGTNPAPLTPWEMGHTQLGPETGSHQRCAPAARDRARDGRRCAACGRGPAPPREEISITWALPGSAQPHWPGWSCHSHSARAEPCTEHYHTHHHTRLPCTTVKHDASGPASVFCFVLFFCFTS